MEPTTFVICPICGKELASLSTKHLKTHNMQLTELKLNFPDVIIYSDVFLEKKKILDSKYREKNKEKIDKYFTKYRLVNCEKRNDYQKEYRKNNLSIVREKNKKYAQLNKDKKKVYDKNYSNENKDKIKQRGKKYREENKDKIIESKKKYNEKNPHLVAWRRILRNSLRDLGNRKNGKTIELLGYSALDLKNHLESRFTEGMTWGNYGEWHIDHIKQVISFPKETPSSVVNALSNLRPLWATTREINGIIYEGNLNREKYDKRKYNNGDKTS